MAHEWIATTNLLPALTEDEVRLNDEREWLNPFHGEKPNSPSSRPTIPTKTAQSDNSGLTLRELTTFPDAARPGAHILANSLRRAADSPENRLCPSDNTRCTEFWAAFP